MQGDRTPGNGQQPDRPCRREESGDEVECYSPFELGASNIDWLSGMYEAVWQQLEESKKVEPQAEEQ